jgi:hypothetical protein
MGALQSSIKRFEMSLEQVRQSFLTVRSFMRRRLATAEKNKLKATGWNLLIAKILWQKLEKQAKLLRGGLTEIQIRLKFHP